MAFKIYDWLYFHKREIIAGCSLIITLLITIIVMLMVFSSSESKDNYNPLSISKQPPPWRRVVYD